MFVKKILIFFGLKVVIENFIGTKSWRKILEGLKRKVDIFIGPKTYLTLKKNTKIDLGTKSSDWKFYRD